MLIFIANDHHILSSADWGRKRNSMVNNDKMISFADWGRKWNQEQPSGEEFELIGI